MKDMKHLKIFNEDVSINTKDMKHLKTFNEDVSPPFSNV